jgi:probable F420-dependent oxidoreductase
MMKKGGQVVKFGVSMFPTDSSIGMVELARAAEEHGFESLWVPEHTHMPTNHSPWPGGGELPPQYSHSLDPFVALGAAAAATSQLRLGTGVCLVIQHHPITLAKQIASLDHLAGGRFLFGIGAGWNRPEIENHGIKPSLRWRVLRENVAAMKEIWTKDEAEYRGRHVNFDPLWSWPKPAQRPHPPVIMGGDGPRAFEEMLQYCDAWMPHPERGDVSFADRIAEANQRAAAAGRGPIPVTAYGGKPEPAAVEVYQAAGAERVVFGLPPAPAAEVLPLIKRYAEVARKFS